MDQRLRAIMVPMALLSGFVGSQTAIAAVALGQDSHHSLSPQAPSAGDTACSPWAAPGARGPEAQICQVWMKYLGSKHRQYQGNASDPSPYWLASEQKQWHVYDLAASYLPDSAAPEVMSIAPDSGLAGEYRIVTRFVSANDDNAMRSRVVTLTVFALRSGNRWVIANALPRLTRRWRRERVGVITYVVPPGYPFDRGRARRAAAFVDSIASAFAIPRPKPMTYYVTSSDDQIYEILGLETAKKWGPVGGLAQPTNHQMFSGIPALGEDYRHELTHMVIVPLLTGRTTYFVSEGVPTWLGGTTGMDFASAARDLAKYLTEHRTVNLDSILTGHYEVAQFYPAAGAFIQLTYSRAGTAGVKALFACGPTIPAFRECAEHVLGRSWASIAADWRELVKSFATVPPTGGESHAVRRLEPACAGMTAQTCAGCRRSQACGDLREIVWGD